MNEMKPSLLILAAGIGSRYGGIKQLDTFGPSGETIMDYSIYDAIRVGFEKVTFVIRKAIEKDFNEAFIYRLQDKIKIEYVFQELEHLPKGYSPPKNRNKPWGTAHAVLVVKEKIKEPFLVLNADDFYGLESFETGYKYLSSLESTTIPQYCILGYFLSKTLSDHGYVSRGVCEIDDNFELKEIVERLKIYRKGKKIVFEEDGNLVEIQGEKYVSMNMMGFTPAFFTQLEDHFEDFLKENMSNPKAEFLLPTVLNNLVKIQKADIKILSTPSDWFGVTYQEDSPIEKAKIKQLIKNGIYPKSLWSQGT
jgi:hypothetical protein